MVQSLKNYHVLMKRKRAWILIMRRVILIMNQRVMF